MVIELGIVHVKTRIAFWIVTFCEEGASKCVKLYCKAHCEKGETPSPNAFFFFVVYMKFCESCCLGEHCKVGSICHLISSKSSDPIVNKYLKGKMQRTLRKELNVL